MPRKILVVDDNAINRQMLINTLRDDYCIVEAENGREAYDIMIRDYRILSAVLLDIVMPEMDGFEVLRLAGENAILSQIPIIMVTSSEDEASRVKALSLGANDFILKPFNPDIVKHCLRNNIALRETASILNAIQKDKLTGLYNREAFFERVSELIKHNDNGFYILSCFDIDNFKLVNDQYGAAEGDRVLREVGDTVKRALDKMDGIAGRISGDNFAALYPDTEENRAELERTLAGKTISLEQWAMVFSVGRYIVTDNRLSASAIYDRAYIAKQSVKGRYDTHMAYFDETMLQKLVRDQQIVSDMESALRERQFEVWFQPQYNHVSHAITGAEALVRWRHPQKGVIPPGEFIPLFEQNGFVYELDKYVWREACRYLRKWLDLGLEPFPVSVNISRYDIFRADLIDSLTATAKEYRIPSGLLHLEITESAFAKSTKLVVEIVKQLRNLGFIIEIDDFGSGYSSLNTLKSVPAHAVKLDMRFLEDGDDEQRGGNILESIVRMTKWLGMAVIAEGVETMEQGDFLKSIGCSHVQGYLYAHPMPAKDYEAHFMGVPRESMLPMLRTVEHMDNNTFWSPQSLDSFIFNSFVGSACIFEYCNGRVELLRATEKCAHMLGGEDMTVDELLTLDVWDYIDRGMSAGTFETIHHELKEKGETVAEFLFIDLPNCPHETYIKSMLRVIAVADDRCLVYCISENITAQRIAERKERAGNARLEAVLANVYCGITAITFNGNAVEFLLANEKFYELLGYTREQYEREICHDFILAICHEDREYVLDVIENVVKTGVSASMEYRALKRDGNIVWLRSYLSMAKFIGVPSPVQICTFADISAEKHTVQDLVDNLPCGAGICSYENGDVRMTYLNKRYFSYFTHSIGRRRTSSVFEVIHPDDRETVREAMLPAFSEGGEGSCIMRILDGPGKYITFRVSGVALDTNEDRRSIYVTFVPVSLEEVSFGEMLHVALEKMMEFSNDLCYVKDKNLRYMSCSSAFVRATGHGSEKDMIGKTDRELFENGNAANYAEEDKQLLRSGEPIIDSVSCMDYSDGKPIYISTSKFPLYNSLGEVIGIYGVGRNVTRTRENEAQNDFLINNIPGGVAIYEGKWAALESIRLTYFSDGFCRLFGYTREEYEKLGYADPTSLVWKQYLPGLLEEIKRLVAHDTPVDYLCRARTKDGSYRWIHLKAVMGERHGEDMTVYAVFLDVTEQQEALERLRVSEEENRLALKHSKNAVCRFDVKKRTLKVSESVEPIFELPAIVEGVPHAQVESGAVSRETAEDYTEFFENIVAGETGGSTVFQLKSSLGWRWIEAHSSTIFSNESDPVSAVISLIDVTESFEKDIAYRKWMQTLRKKEPDSYSLFRCNISRQTCLESIDGSLLKIKFRADARGFDDNVLEYAAEFVSDKDRERLKACLSIESLLEKYKRGERNITLEYRERIPSDGVKWLRLTVDLVEYPHSADIEAYVLFEDIDEMKKQELLTLERAETDPLTGVLNRTAFAERVNDIIRHSKENARHALLMMDIDGFKFVNDVFGHGTGDRTLVNIAALIRTSLRRNDLVSRLGGDEFIVLLENIPDERIAGNKAKQICDLSRIAFSEEVKISGSVGISMYPDDGADFETLYKKADEALYYVKSIGRDDYAFYREDMKEEKRTRVDERPERKNPSFYEKKRRMLIVDDNRMDFEFLANIFENDFIIEKARDGNSALIRMRHYGTAISVVLLDLIMPGMDGFSVLRKMQQSAEMQSIPVIVVSAADDRETSLRAIREGAVDYVMKPVDTDVLKIRVQSAISKAENERLRAQNNYLELTNAETLRYKTVVEKLNIAVAEIEWGKNAFSYSPGIGKRLFGRYDGRTLWHIFLTDMVTDAETVRRIQQYVHDLAEDRQRKEGVISVRLKAASGKWHMFTLSVYKLTNDYGLSDRMILTFKDEGVNEHSDTDQGTSTVD